MRKSHDFLNPQKILQARRSCLDISPQESPHSRIDQSQRSATKLTNNPQLSPRRRTGNNAALSDEAHECAHRKCSIPQPSVPVSSHEVDVDLQK
ncbi:hypothetical protein VTN49DRAFT_4892 [Thermomyces lanuginosus]|uniref:uncharacterized protein n=1 Tax=Thermomyces lanuginosus TaxID=5541 RepID=UPI00374321B3